MTSAISTKQPRRAFRGTSAMFVAAVTAGALFATVAGANAAPASSHHTSASATASADESEFTPAEQAQGAALAKGIAELGLSEDQFASALDVVLNRPTPDPEAFQSRLAALPAEPTARQIAEAAYPNDSAAQAALSPLFANKEVRHTLLAQIAGGKKDHKLFAASWWDETKFIIKCSAAIAAVLISFAPAGSSIKVVRAVALFKRYGAKKTANIIWRFVNGKRVGSAEREAVKAFIGISAISAACSR
ncbi:hypothetical protein OH805_21110 [Streptomyces sp. NBC_00879]|uniref:hypothetical protein n=1 Tax=unclassified Streptomyces TaxID=2593676 RepID=UPI002D7693F1|nr:hypothetical protein [Streptomyces sp.]WSY76444.1 hypothetical protein OH805_21110 [Streptomyces sp. NBC_00879]HET6357587.1 hypothetical protein [Streptomyces sp.]